MQSLGLSNKDYRRKLELEQCFEECLYCLGVDNRDYRQKREQEQDLDVANMGCGWLQEQEKRLDIGNGGNV